MFDFMPEEQLYISGIDEADPARVFGCRVLGGNANEVKIQLVNGAIRTVPLFALYRWREDAVRAGPPLEGSE